ncbi:DUF5906 domain-containing protein [Methanococcoides sp. AM1]|uniref:DUF5906 domain-containing protein n=1 Tax=Methanococcoides sp. AM1 TaxID=1201011 RepID=UPI001083DE69|nr:DUF5906 domain-containing protein [Methanococcoides sp. AM1]
MAIACMISHFAGKREDSDKAELLMLADTFIEELEGLSWYNELASIDLTRCFTVRDSGKVEIVPEAIAEEVAEAYNVISYNDLLYVYQDGYYQEGKRRIESLIHSILTNVGDGNKTYDKSHEAATREIIHRLKVTDPYFEYPFNNYENIIPVSNGLVKIDFDAETYELIPNNPYYKFNYRLNVAYDPDAEYDAIHDDVISKYVDGEECGILYQIPAQAILQMMGTAPYKKAYILQGDANAGKTAYLTFLALMFGKASISNMSLQQLTADRFSTANLEGKILNTYDDLSDIPLNEGGVIKTITGTKDHWVQKKNVQAYEATINAVHCYACNIAPDASKLHNDTAFWERWEFIYFSNLFEVDPGFYGTYFTQKNISGFFNRVLEMVVRIKKYGLMYKSSASDVLNKWTQNSDPLYRFLDDNLVFNDNPMYYTKDDFLNMYRAYCEHERIAESKRPMNVAVFSQLLFKYGVGECQVTSQADGVRKRCYSVYRTWCSSSVYQNMFDRVIASTKQSKI